MLPRILEKYGIPQNPFLHQHQHDGSEQKEVKGMSKEQQKVFKEAIVATPPKRPPRRDSSLHRRDQEDRFRKGCSVCAQVILFLQFLTVITLLTLILTFKMEMQNFSEKEMNLNGSFNSTGRGTCSIESTVTINQEEWALFMNRVFNISVGVLLLFIMGTILTLLYLRRKNVTILLILLITWTLVSLIFNDRLLTLLQTKLQELQPHLTFTEITTNCDYYENEIERPFAQAFHQPSQTQHVPITNYDFLNTGTGLEPEHSSPSLLPILGQQQREGESSGKYHRIPQPFPKPYNLYYYYNGIDQ